MIIKRRSIFTFISISSFCIVIFSACSSSKKSNAVAKAPLNLYQTLPDSSEKKTLFGLLSTQQLTQDTAFEWYAANLKYFKVDSATVQNIRAKKDKIHLVLFCGTWCHDSQQLIPKYLTTLEAAGFPEEKLTIFGVDRNKETVGGFNRTFNVTLVPTLIVMQDGKEVDRITEYGKTALVDKELGEIISAIH